MARASHPQVLIFGGGLGGITNLAGTATNVLVSTHTPGTEQGLALGSLGAVGALSAICGPTLFGDVYAHWKVGW
jgi:hypothetical protein